MYLVSIQLVRTWIIEAPGCVVLYVGSVYLHDSTGMQRPKNWKTIIYWIPYIQVYTMPVWYMLAYTSTSQYENITPVYTGNYLYERNRLVLSRWWRFQMFGPGVGLWFGWEKEQNPCIPNWIWWHHEGSTVETRRPNHDEVQAMTVIRRLRRKRVAVNSLQNIVLDLTKHQTVVQWEMALALRWICQVQCLKHSIYLHNNYNNYNNYNNSNLKNEMFTQISCASLLLPTKLEHRSTPQLMLCFTARPKTIGGSGNLLSAPYFRRKFGTFHWLH